jgi:hypothetical protein
MTFQFVPFGLRRLSLRHACLVRVLMKQMTANPIMLADFCPAQRKGLPHLSGSRPRDRRFHVERKTKEQQY